MTRTVRRMPDIRYGEVLGFRPLELDLYVPEADGPIPPVLVALQRPPADQVPASRRVELTGMPLRRLSSARLSRRRLASNAESSVSARSITGSPCGGRLPGARRAVICHWLEC